ncbi:hypothetical protein BUALT_Bualt02G0060600 [Buddleja alternifolia]|uniref:Uncharacterized protein n=1 Tax=Buddleja alternifolia TaxID=168488 RepID=A0AAV6Y5T9_9LAMI|nr:hypothetical protein BUALT_Bualt02G0060600 [Buddleja alternifolia]
MKYWQWFESHGGKQISTSATTSEVDILHPPPLTTGEMPELNRRLHSLHQLFAASLPQRRCCSANSGTESPPPRFSLSIALIRESPPLQSLLRRCYSTARKPLPELDMRLSKL